MPIRVCCFGKPCLWGPMEDGSDGVLLPAGKPLLILAYLALHPGGASRDTLALLGWGTRDDAHAKASLRQAIYRLRQAVGRDRLLADETSVRLGAPLPSDWQVANDAVRRGDDAALLQAASGSFLEGIEDREADGFDSWLATERLQWALQVRDAATREGRRLLAQGSIDSAVALAERALEARDDQLVTWELYLDALLATGNVARHEHGLAKLEAAGQHGLTGKSDPVGWQRLARRARNANHREGGGDRDASAPGIGQLPLVGRDTLMAYTVELLNLPPGERQRIIAIVGGPGFGKSRVLRELRRRLAATDHHIAFVEARTSEARTPWAFLNRVVQALAELPDALGVDPAEAAVLLSLNPQLAKRFVGTRSSGPAIPDHEAMVRALAELLGAVGEHWPLVLLVDDSQWVDPESRSVLRAAFSRNTVGRSVCLLTTRNDAMLLPSDWYTVHLASLDIDDVTALLTRQFPAMDPSLCPALSRALLLVTGGVPSYLTRAFQRLTPVLASERTAAEILDLVATLELHRDPAFPTGAVERHLLGYLAMAGGSVSYRELAECCPALTAGHGNEMLVQMERQGWIISGEHGFALGHELVQRQVTEVLSAADLRALALEHAQFLARHGEAIHDLRNAIHLCFAEAALPEALSVIRNWRRRMHDAPTGRELVALVLPHDADLRWRWRLQAAASPRLLHLVATAMCLIALTAWAVAGWLGQPTSLRLENIPRVPGYESTSRVRRNIVPPLFTVRDRLGRISSALDGNPLEVVGWSVSVDSALLAPAPTARHGMVSATSLDVFSGLDGDNDVSFRLGSLPVLPVRVFRGYGHQSLAIGGGFLNGVALADQHPEVSVAPGDSLIGLVTLRYTTPQQAALWMLAETSTMNPHTTDTNTVVTLHSGAVDGLTEVMIRRRVPSQLGVYWLLWTFAAEPSAADILSLTNWRCPTPHWDDGNDLLPLADSTLERIWGGGMLTVRRELCETDELPRLEKSYYSTAALKVVVGR
ncbi:MAG: AAA family ATPase [Gemmatimonadales bacterium]|nr:AAA family ATPase [Gemmatimonadales bacterium]